MFQSVCFSEQQLQTQVIKLPKVLFGLYLVGATVLNQSHGGDRERLGDEISLVRVT